ncbi:MAG: trimethylamine methyltransferase family protein, partial [Boseongicola sp.]
MPVTRRSKRRGRGGHGASNEPRTPFIRRKLGTFSVLSEEGLSTIEANADQILAETGMEFHGDPEVLEIFNSANCGIDGTRVRFPPGICRKIIQDTAPSQFVQHARNSVNSVEIGGDATVLCPSWGPPFVHDLDQGRRYATYEDFQT